MAPPRPPRGHPRGISETVVDDAAHQRSGTAAYSWQSAESERAQQALGVSQTRGGGTGAGAASGGSQVTPRGWATGLRQPLTLALAQVACSFPNGGLSTKETPKAGWARKGKCPKSLRPQCRSPAARRQATRTPDPERSYRARPPPPTTPSSAPRSECVYNHNRFSGPRTEPNKTLIYKHKLVTRTKTQLRKTRARKGGTHSTERTTPPPPGTAPYRRGMTALHPP